MKLKICISISVCLFFLVFLLLLLNTFSLQSFNARMMIRSVPNKESCFNTVTENTSNTPPFFPVRKCEDCVKVYIESASGPDYCYPEL